jgi:uncharacterized protein (TIGR02145 family)
LYSNCSGADVITDNKGEVVKHFILVVFLCFGLISFSGCDSETVTDIDGNIYKTVTIGSQVWMQENLKTTGYRDGSPIEYPGADNIHWLTNTDGAYAWYDNDEALYKDTCGALYNWHAVSNPAGLCPEGWSVPTNDDWQLLFDFLGGDDVAGGKLKTTGTIEDGTGLWESPNAGATNESGFSVVPAGIRLPAGWFDYLGGSTCLWSSSEINTLNAWGPALYTGNAGVFRGGGGKQLGFSVRCLKD